MDNSPCIDDSNDLVPDVIKPLIPPFCVQLEIMARECAALRASLADEQAARSAADDAEEERRRGREGADAALRAGAETVAQLEGELARARSGAAAAARELEELTAKLGTETAKVSIENLGAAH